MVLAFSNPVHSLQMGFAGIAVGAAMVRSPLIILSYSDL